METDVPRHPEAEAVLAAEIADSTEPTPPETVAAPVRNRLVMAIKHKVSKSRQRFVDDGLDLDLTYITKRVIAMGLPATGVEGVYRNNIDDVVKLLNKRHPNHYLIFNLSQKQYDESKFSSCVLNWGWPDHFPPPLATLFLICQSMASWLSSDPENIAVVHCKAGKGRTGTVIAAFCLYCRLFSEPEEALYYFAGRRSIGGGYSLKGGVTIPSQKRYVRYFGRIVDGYKPSVEPWILRRIIVSSILLAKREGSASQPYVKIYKWVNDWNKHRDILFTSKPRSRKVRKEELMFQVDVNVALAGDVLFRFKVNKSRFQPRHGDLFHFVIHTGFIPDTGVLRLHKCDLDDGYKNRELPEDLFIDLVFERNAAPKAVAAKDPPADPDTSVEAIPLRPAIALSTGSFMPWDTMVPFRDDDGDDDGSVEDDGGDAENEGTEEGTGNQETEEHGQEDKKTSLNDGDAAAGGEESEQNHGTTQEKSSSSSSSSRKPLREGRKTSSAGLETLSEEEILRRRMEEQIPILEALPLTEVTDKTLVELGREAESRGMSVEKLMQIMDASGRLVAATRHMMPRRRRLQSVTNRFDSSASIPSITIINETEHLGLLGAGRPSSVSLSLNSAVGSRVDSPTSHHDPPILDEAWDHRFPHPPRHGLDGLTNFRKMNAALGQEFRHPDSAVRELRKLEDEEEEEKEELEEDAFEDSDALP